MRACFMSKANHQNAPKVSGDACNYKIINVQCTPFFQNYMAHKKIDIIPYPESLYASQDRRCSNSLQATKFVNCMPALANTGL